MIIKTACKVMVLALLFAVPLASRAAPIQPVVITNWYSGVNDAATLAAETGAGGGIPGRHVQWKDTEPKPTHTTQVMGLEQEVGVIQFRASPLLQGHGLFSFNDAFGTNLALNQMPSNSVITDAKLWLYVTSFSSTQIITVAGLSPLNRNWVENSACFSYQSNTTPWVGGVFSGGVLKTYNTISNPASTGWKGIDITEPVKDYVTNVIGGLALLSQTNAAPAVQNVYFASDQHDTPSWTPGMRATYWLLPTPNPLPATDIWAQKFTANWENVLGVDVTITNYHLDVATDPRFYHGVGIYTNLEMGSNLSCLVTGLTENTTYYYRLHDHLGRVVSFYNVTTLVQTRRLQTIIDFPAISSQWVGNVVALLATTESGLAPTFTVINGPGVITNGNLLSFSGTGLVSVVASQLGDAHWDPALPTVTNTFLVYKRPQAIVFPALGTNRTTDIVHLGATASSGLPVSFALMSGPGQITNGNVLTFTGTGVVQVVASQAGNFAYLAAAPVTNLCVVEGKAVAAVYLNGLTGNVYDGAAKYATATTMPAGLTVRITYNGTALAPSNGGTYAVTGRVEHFDYQGEASGTLVIEKAAQTITSFTPADGSAFKTTNIVALAATASSGLTPVTFSVVSGPGALLGAAQLGFTGAGAVEVRASQVGDGNYTNTSAIHTVTVTKATAGASVALSNLAHTYDGTAKSAMATTVPAGLTVLLTYNGSATAPSNAGTYAVTGMLNSATYQAETNGTMIISNASPIIDFPLIPDQYVSNVVRLAASSSSGLPATNFSVVSGPASLSGGSNLAFSATGVVSIAVGDTGDGNWNAAAATNTFSVHDVVVWIDGTNGQLLASEEAPSRAKGTDFGSVGALTSQTNRFWFGNGATSDLAVASWTINGDGAAAFTVVEIATNVAGGTLSNLLVSFAPTNLAAYTAAVVIVHDGATNNPYTLYLAGTGTSAAVLWLDHTNVGFTAVHGTDPARQWDSFYNRGAADMDYAVTLGQGAGTWLSVTPVSGTLPGGWSTSLELGASVAGLNAGVYQGTATVSSVQATNSPLSIAVTLNVTQAAAGISLSGLWQAYDGTARTATVATVPAGLGVTVTYNGASTLPTNVGTYAVTALVAEVNYQGVASGVLTVTRADAQVNLGNMLQAYDGSPRAATVVTVPAGLNVTLTYNGSATAPTDVGSYVVTGLVNEANYQGSAVGVLTVSKGTAGITLSALSQIYDGTPRLVSVVTAPAGLEMVVSYNGNTNPPVIAGSYDVVAWVTNCALYNGAAYDVLTVNKALPTITNFTPLSGSVFEATNIVELAAQSSSGLTPVTFSVVSGPGALVSAAQLGFTGVGAVEIRASQIGDGNFIGCSAVSTVTVSKAACSVILTNLTQTYNGTPRNVSARTVPAGLTVQLTYDGSLTVPSNVGSYTVIGTIVDPIYSGASTETLVVGKGVPVIHFPQIPDQYYTRMVGLAATSDSGQPVTFDLLPGGPGTIDPVGTPSGTNLTFSGTGLVSVVATDPLGDLNWQAASVTNTFAVHDVLVWMTGTNGQLVASGEAQSRAKGTDFGAVGKTTAQTNLFRIGNETASPLGPISWTTNGAGASAFTVVGFTTNIAAGGISNLLVRFAPTADMTYTAAVVITHGGPTNNPFTLYLSGTGTPAATLGFDSAGLDFATEYGTDPAAQALVLTNSGGAAGAFAGVLSQGAGTWLSMSPMSGSLNGYGSASLAVQASVAGLSVGVYRGTVTVYSVQATNSPQSVPVTLTITQALAKVSIAGVYQVYDGSAKPVTTWTTPAGKTVDVTYAGLPGAPTNAGTYAVTGLVNDVNYYGSATSLLTVAVADAQVSLGNMDQIYDGTARTTTVSTVPAGLNVTVTYNGGAALPTNAGVYAVTGVVSELNYRGAATGTLYVRQALGTIFIESLLHVYDGAFHAATATTMPAGLVVTFTYNAATNLPDKYAAGDAQPMLPLSTILPRNAGSYAVHAMIVELNYHGIADATLVIEKGAQTIAFAAISNQMVTSTVALAATASSELPVTFAVASGPGVISGGTTLRFTETGVVVIVASQGGNTNWNAAPDVTNSIIVNIADYTINDYDGDGASDLAVYREGEWYIYSVARAKVLNVVGEWGGPLWIPVPGDYDDDGKSDMAVYRDGTWYIYSVAKGVVLNVVGNWGGPLWTPVFGDYDADGKYDLAVYRDGEWYIYSAAKGVVLNVVGNWGGPGWTPVPGDYDGDGKADLAVYRDGTWYIYSVARGVVLNVVGNWGGLGWTPVSGDYDGDGASDLAVYREGEWYIYSVARGVAINVEGIWGGPGWTPVR